MIGKRELSFLAFHFILFIALPYIPREILMLSDMLLIRLVLLAILIWSMYVSPLVGISTFVVIALIFVERNKAKMNHLETAMSQSTPDSPAIADIQTPETAPPQIPFQRPDVESHPFMPQPDSGDDSFAPVAETLNQKQPLPTEASNEGSQKAISQLYGWVNNKYIQQA